MKKYAREAYDNFTKDGGDTGEELYKVSSNIYNNTVMVLSFRTDMPGQTVQTQIRLLHEEQSD